MTLKEVLAAKISAHRFSGAEIAQKAATAEVFFGGEAVIGDIIENLTADLEGDPPKGEALTDLRVIAALGCLEPDALDAVLDVAKTAMCHKSMRGRYSIRDLRKRIASVGELVLRARQAQQASAAGYLAIIDIRDSQEVARKFLSYSAFGKSNTVLFSSKVWYFWQTNAYRQVQPEEIRKKVYEFLGRCGERTQFGVTAFKANPTKVESAVHALSALQVTDPSRIGHWLDAETERPKPGSQVVFANGILAVERWLACEADALIQPTPQLFNLATLPYNFDPKAKAPLFEQTIHEIFSGDEDRIRALRVFGGYLMTADTSLQVIMCLIGPGGSGKGTILAILHALLGRDLCTSPTLSDLSDRFGLQSFLGKNLAMITDAQWVGTNVRSSVERLLAISGEDAVRVDVKYAAPIAAIKLTTRFMMAMNELVALPDNAGALFSRLVFLPFTNKFRENGDPTRRQRIIDSEMPGIANWFLGGLRLLTHARAAAVEQGRSAATIARELLRCPSADEIKLRFRRLSSCIVAFIEDECVLGDSHAIEWQEMTFAFDCWSENNHHRDRNRDSFLEELRAVAHTVTDTTTTDPSGKRVRILRGITLRTRVENAKPRPANSPGGTPKPTVQPGSPPPPPPRAGGSENAQPAPAAPPYPPGDSLEELLSYADAKPKWPSQ